MKNQMFVLLIFFMSYSAIAGDSINVSLNSELIYFKGCNYLTRDSSGITPSRFSDDVLNMEASILNFFPVVAKQTSGIQMFFSTSSNNIYIKIKLMPFVRSDTTTFRVYQDNRFFNDFRFLRLKQGNMIEIKLSSSNNKLHDYRIDFPTNVALKITTFSIDKGRALHKMHFQKKPVYVALGNSITHGSVALNGLSDLTYPYILAKKMNYDLYNLGIGGSKVSPTIGNMLKDWKQIDLITLLIGINDFGYGVDLETFRDNFKKLVEAIRRNHPATPLYCITPTFVTVKKSKKTGISPDEYRQIECEIVKSFQERGDDKIFLLHGEKLTDETCLYDKVHFTISGNNLFAEKLFREISKTVKVNYTSDFYPEPTYKDVSYGPYPRNKLDIYLAKSELPTPVLVLIHGGAFRYGDKTKIKINDFGNLLNLCLENKISVVSINYRLSLGKEYHFRYSKKTPVPPAYEDAAHAVQFIRYNATKYNIDKKKLAVSGGSAGGGIALWLGLYDDMANPDDKDPIGRESTRPVSVVAMYAQTTYDQEFITRKMHYDGYQIDWIDLLFDATTEELRSAKTRKMRKAASPLNQVDAGDKNTSIFMCKANEYKFSSTMNQNQFVHNVVFYYELEKKLKRYGIPYELVLNSEYKTGKRKGNVDMDALLFLKKAFKMN